MDDKWIYKASYSELRWDRGRNSRHARLHSITVQVVPDNEGSHNADIYSSFS